MHSLLLRVIDRGTHFYEERGHGDCGRHHGAVGAGASAGDPHGNRHSGRAGAGLRALIGRLGHFIEPVIAPLGFNWKIGIGLVSSVLAREVMVSTLGTLYGADPSTQALNLQTALHHDMTLGGALALMIFFAFAMQCTSTMAVVKRETNSWKWPAVQFLYMLALAYGAAFVVNHVTMALLG